MTKWGMPGVYTHAFMDGWSPGYLGSVAYNHNGMMRMYETQSGRESGPGGRGAAAAEAVAAAGGGRRVEAGARPWGRGGREVAAQGAGRGEDAARAMARRRAGDAPAQAAAEAAAGGADAAPPAGADRAAAAGSRASGIAASRFRPARPHNFSRRNNTNYMQTGVLSAACSSRRCSRTSSSRTSTGRRRTRSRPARTSAPHGYVIPVQRDMTRVAELVNILRTQRIEVGQATAEIKISDGTFPAGSYVIKRDQPYGRLAKNLLEKQNYPDPNLRTYDDSGWTMGLAMLVDVKEIKDKAILDVADDAGEGSGREGEGHRQRARPASRSRTTARTT